VANPEIQQLQPMHSLLTSAIQLPFAKAARELGCAELPQSLFMAEIEPYLLHTTAFDLPNTEETRVAIWRAIQHAPVLAVEALPNGGMSFHVRAQMKGGLCIDVRLVYRSDQWRVQAVTSIHRIPFLRTRWFARVATAGSVVLAGLIGFVIADQLHPASTSTTATQMTEQGVAAWAAAHGYQLTKVNNTSSASNSSSSQGQGSAAKTANTSNTANRSSGEATSTQSSKDKSKSATQKKQTYTFTLKEGMSLHSLSVFLKQKHLVKDAVAFDMKMKDTGVDKDLRPGKYTFTSGMSESQLIKVLKAGPKS
jgi:hypothetical protein